MSTAGKRWAYAREIVLALAVLALTFLNYGHVSVSASGDLQVTPDSWCGSPLAPDDIAHAPCHACRVDGAALPPPPACVEPVAFAVVPVAYVAPAVTTVRVLHARPILPRGPPALV